MMKFYKTLGNLLFDYRKEFSHSQENFAEKLAIEPRTYQRWERDQHPAKKDNLLNIAKVTGIPMNTLIALNFGQYIFYCLHKRTMAFSKLEISMLIFEKLMKEGLPEDDGITIKFQPISKKSTSLNQIIHYDNKIYPTNNPISTQTLMTAAQILPQLNFVVLDQWDLHVGHLTCLPLSTETYNKIKDREISEGDIRPQDLCNISKFKSGVLYFWSRYGVTASIIHNTLFKSAIYISKYYENTNTSITTMAVTKVGHEICQQLQMYPVWQNHQERQEFNMEVTPTLYECTIKHFLDVTQRSQF